MIINALAIDLLLIGAIYLLGALQARIILRSKFSLEILSLSFPLGLGTLTLSLFLLSWLGLRISIITIMLLYMVLFVGHFFLLKRSNIPMQSFVFRNSLSILSSIPWVLMIFLFLSAIFLSVGRAYSSWDAIAIWSVKGYGIALEGTIFAGKTWGSLGLSYPLNLSVAISVFKLFSGDVLPGSKLIFPLMFISLIINIYTFFTRRNIRQTQAKFGLLFLASVPLLFKHATIGYANLAFTTYIVLGALYAMEGIYGNRPGALGMSGVLLGFATWTRQEGLFLSLLVVMTISLTWLIYRKEMPKFVPWLTPLVSIGVVWFIFARFHGTEGQITRTLREALPQISQGHFHLDNVYQIMRYAVRQMLDPSIWGLLFPASLLLFILAGPRRFAPKESIFMFGGGATTLSIGIAVLFYYYIVSFRQTPLEWWLSTSFNRMILPIGVLLGILATLALGSFSYRSSQQ